jgi:hypothetical protein
LSRLVNSSHPLIHVGISILQGKGKAWELARNQVNHGTSQRNSGLAGI